MKDPVTGVIKTDPQDIRETVLKYCKNLLTNREPSSGFEIDLTIKKETA